MAIQVILDAKVYVGGYNLSGFSNEAHLTQTPAMLEANVFGNGSTRRNVPGLFNFKAEVAGFMDYAYPIGAAPLDQNNSMNSALFSKLQGAFTGNDVASLAPLGNSELDLAYTFQHVQASFSPVGGQDGQLIPYKLDMECAGVRLVRGSVLGVGNKTATGGSAAPYNIPGGVLAGQKLYAGLHVVGASGTTPTLDVIVRSSTTIGMASPTTRLTFPQYTTTVGASWVSAAGPITDAYYDVRWTITGGSPNYTIFVVVGAV